MPSVKMLTITVDPGGLSLRRSGSSARNTALPDLSETVEFQNDVDCMAFSCSPKQVHSLLNPQGLPVAEGSGLPART